MWLPGRIVRSHHAQRRREVGPSTAPFDLDGPLAGDMPWAGGVERRRVMVNEAFELVRRRILRHPLGAQGQRDGDDGNQTANNKNLHDILQERFILRTEFQGPVDRTGALFTY